ncbi:protein NDR1-like [Mangifera indica]|uniref:protein NDR1-like n=1 Tax=Mangifera indica TaxID=29780 RepID=UPI001CFBED0D|nr:protein NDR1-like [Mangifera indica]
MSDEPQGFCRCCCSFIFTLGLTALFMWLSLRSEKPKCSIQDFYLPALNKSLNSPNNTTLYFKLKLQNPNKDKGIFYDPVNVTIYNKSNTTTSYIGSHVVPNFYQGHKKTARKDGNVTAEKDVLEQAVFANRTAVFRLNLATKVRFKIIFWKTKRYMIMVGADVVVNDNGSKDPVGQKKRKDVKLSQAPVSSRFCGIVGILLNFLVFILLNF